MIEVLSKKKNKQKNLKDKKENVEKCVSRDSRLKISLSQQRTAGLISIIEG